MKAHITARQSIVIAAIVVATAGLGAWIMHAPDASEEKEKEEASAPAKKKSEVPVGAGGKTVAAKTTETEGARKLPPTTEGNISLTEKQIADAGISMQTAASATIKNIVTLPGEVRFNDDRMAHIVPRFAGVVEVVGVVQGQSIKKGQAVAEIASAGVSDIRSELLTAKKRLAFANAAYEREKTLWQEKISAEQDYLQAQQAYREAQIAVQNAQGKLAALGAPAGSGGSLNRYIIRTPLTGTVVEKHLALGDAVKEDTAILTVADLSTVWIDITVPTNALKSVHVGESVTVKSAALDAHSKGVVSYMSALVGDQTRTGKARITLSNPDLVWRPGLLVSVDIVASEASAAVSVLSSAVQNVNDRSSVFIRTADGFVAQPVTLGRSDGMRTEVMQGLKTGSLYASNGSFILKAELGKSSAKDND